MSTFTPFECLTAREARGKMASYAASSVQFLANGTETAPDGYLVRRASTRWYTERGILKERYRRLCIVSGRVSCMTPGSFSNKQATVLLEKPNMAATSPTV
jgi:hypothetical protein